LGFERQEFMYCVGPYFSPYDELSRHNKGFSDFLHI
jgi:hypothetical protein